VPAGNAARARRRRRGACRPDRRRALRPEQDRPGSELPHRDLAVLAQIASRLVGLPLGHRRV